MKITADGIFLNDGTVIGNGGYFIIKPANIASNVVVPEGSTMFVSSLKIEQGKSITLPVGSSIKLI